MKSHRTLLNALLQALVDEWGQEKVAAALANAEPSSRDQLAGRAADRNLRIHRTQVRPSATEQIKLAAIDDERRVELMQIAERYDQRQFLPSLADVREFLIMMDERPVGMKDRRDAFRVLLRSLMQLPVERIQQLNRSAQHSGPSRLGPLSEAISAAGERLPRMRFANGDMRVSMMDFAIGENEEKVEPALPK